MTLAHVVGSPEFYWAIVAELSLFPSGHTAYAVTIAVFLVARDRRWLKAVPPLLALIAVALVLANYHVVEDIAGGTAVGLAVGLGAGRAARERPLPWSGR